MKNFCTLLILLLMLNISAAYAGAIEKCVDSKTGKVTYTDKGCKSKETAEDTYIIGAGNKKREKSNAIGYKISEIGILTQQASEQCGKHAVKYFTDSHSDLAKDVTSEFSVIKDRSIKGIDVKIILEGVVHYQNNDQPGEMKILCTATKSRNADWALAFTNLESGTKTQAKADGN